MGSTRAWAVRSKPHHIPRMCEFLAHGMVAIGWPGLGDLTGVDRDEIRRRLKPQAYTRGDPRQVGQQSGELDRFVNEMRIGDFVVVPNDAEIFVAEVVSHYVYRADQERPDDGYSHWRMVTYLNDRRPFARGDLPDGLARALGCQITVFSVPIHDVWSLLNVPGPPPTEHFVRPPIFGIEQLMERIESGRNLPERNMEAAVEDLLRHLGHDAKRIVFQSGRIDVAINDLSGKPEFVFEVKRSISQRTVRDQARRQAFDYAARTGARFVVLTDSDRYEIYDRKEGLDHGSMLIGSFQLTKFRREDIAMLDELRPTAGTIGPSARRLDELCHQPLCSRRTPEMRSAGLPAGYDSPMKMTSLDIPDAKLADFCQRWRITELALFGSVLREDFGPGSDVDVLITFQPDAPWSLWDLMAARDELQDIFGRRVDLVEKDAIRNPFRRHEILRTHQVIYAA